MIRCARAILLLAGLVSASACQSPTSASSTFNVDNFVDATATPNPAPAVADTDGKTYRVVVGNNQPDEILPYQYIATYTVVLTINQNATNSSNDVKFPVTITTATAKVQQANNGIVTPPTGGETEHYDSVLLSSSTNSISQVGGGAQMVFQMWYALPSKGKEALITESVSMQDNSSSPKTFTKTVQIKVSP
jgi:hypothetical protein